MKAIKQNRAYTISADQATAFARAGYDVYDDNGKIVQYGAGKTVAYTQYVKALKTIDEQKDIIAALEDEIASLKKKRSKKAEVKEAEKVEE